MKPQMDGRLLFFVSLFYAVIFVLSCAKKDLDKDDYASSIKFRTGECVDIAFKEFRLKTEEADRLKALNQTKQAEVKYSEAYQVYLQNELDYMNLQGQISNVRLLLSQQKHELDAMGDSPKKITAEMFLKNAEQMINVCKPPEAISFINKSRDLFK